MKINHTSLIETSHSRRPRNAINEFSVRSKKIHTSKHKRYKRFGTYRSNMTMNIYPISPNEKAYIECVFNIACVKNKK